MGEKLINIGHTILLLSETDSTNKHTIRQIADNELEEGTVFLAHKQTEGRGQQNNKWESEAGLNLTFSIFLRPDFLSVNKQFMVSKIVSLGLVSFLRQYIDEVSIKWPNDIYVGEKKICGILIENGIINDAICYSVIGIGLNVNQIKFHSLPNPISLKMLTGTSYNIDELLPVLLKEIDKYYLMLRKGEATEIDNSFLGNLYRLQVSGSYRDKAHCFRGRILGVNEIGQLIIEEESGKINTYHFKEIEFL